MKTAKVYVNDIYAGDLEEMIKGKEYRFTYHQEYDGTSVSLSMPVSQKIYIFDCFPSFFDGLLPEGVMLKDLLRKRKIDADDYFEQLMSFGGDTIGNVTVKRALATKKQKWNLEETQQEIPFVESYESLR